MTVTAGAATQRPAQRRPHTAGRFALLALGGACLLTGLLAGLALLGLPVPVSVERFADVHGQLMLVGFLGTVICLERAVAVRRPWAYLAPMGTGLGGLALLTYLPAIIGLSLQAAGLAVLVLCYAAIWRRAPSQAVAIQWLGAFLGVGGAVLWVGGVPTGAVFPWWAGFLVLTIVGERVELARVAAPPPGAIRVLMGLALAVAGSAAASILWPTPGTEVFGASILGVVAWLARYDVATRLVRSRGLPRYIAVNLLLGMAWLGVAGVVWVLTGPASDGAAIDGAAFDGAAFDIVIHAAGLGFALSMVLAHAPVILPAVLLRPLPYRPVLYAATIVLQVTLTARVFADVRSAEAAWQVAGVGNVIALLLFVTTAAVLVIRR